MLANALLLVSFLLIYSLFKNNSFKTATIAGISAFLLNLVLPFESALLYVFTVSLMIFLYFKNRIIFKNNALNIILFFIISAPPFFYMAYLGIYDSLWSVIEKQNILTTPSLINLLLGYGIVPLFSIIGLWALNKKDNFKFIFFSLWISLVFILSHIPISLYPMQRRFIETVFYVPLAITAGFGATAIYDYLKQKQIKNLNYKIFLFSLLFLLPALFFGNLQAWYRYNFAITQNENPFLYLPNKNINAMKWIKQNIPNDSIILASFYNSNNIPYFADKIVYMGHGALTVNFREKLIKTEKFYSGKYSVSEAFDFLKKERVNYIFYSEEEKISARNGEQFNQFNPEDYSFLENIYQNNTVKIYKFINNN